MARKQLSNGKSIRRQFKQIRNEFDRLINDMHIYDALANNFAEKASAALDVLRYKYSNDINDLEKGTCICRKASAIIKNLWI